MSVLLCGPQGRPIPVREAYDTVATFPMRNDGGRGIDPRSLGGSDGYPATLSYHETAETSAHLTCMDYASRSRDAGPAGEIPVDNEATASDGEIPADELENVDRHADNVSALVRTMRGQCTVPASHTCAQEAGAARMSALIAIFKIDL